MLQGVRDRGSPASLWASELTCVVGPTVFQSEGISLQATSCSEELQCCQSEILELRCTVNAMEVELQAQHNLVSSYVCMED